MEGDIEQTQEKTEDATDSINTTEINVNSSKTTSEDTIKQEETTVAKQTTTVQEPTYAIQEFINNSKALGYRKEVVAGALFGCVESEITKAEFEIIIKNFLGKKVE